MCLANVAPSRDLKPENILLSRKCILSRTSSLYPVAKLSDFGVSHIFEENDEEPAGHRLDNGPNRDSELSSAGLAKHHIERCLSMSSKSDSGLLTKTEGTWCKSLAQFKLLVTPRPGIEENFLLMNMFNLVQGFWSPEMCQGQKAFSGYAAGEPSNMREFFRFHIGALSDFSNSHFLPDSITDRYVGCRSMSLHFRCRKIAFLFLCST